MRPFVDQLRSYARKGRLSAEYVLLRVDVARGFDERPIDELLSRLSRPGRASARVDLDDVLASIRRAESVLNHLRRHPDSCLQRAVARYSLLRRLGYRPRFVMGVHSADHQEKGHAWVELDDATVLEGNTPRYHVTYVYPASAA